MLYILKAAIYIFFFSIPTEKLMLNILFTVHEMYFIETFSKKQFVSQIITYIEI